MRARRLVIFDAAGEPLIAAGGLMLMIDLDGVYNANAQIPLQVVIQEQCDLEHWHERRVADLPCWSG